MQTIPHFALLALLLPCGVHSSSPAPSNPPPPLAPLDLLIEQDWELQDHWFARNQEMIRTVTALDQKKRLAPVTAASPPAPPAPRPATPATAAEDAAGGCDGIKDGSFGFHTASQELDPWWEVDLGKATPLDRIVVYNRTDGKTAGRTRFLRILAAASENRDFLEIYRHGGEPFFGAREKRPLIVPLRDSGVAARIVRLQVPGRCSLALDEVEVYGTADPATNLALGRPAGQKSTGPFSRSRAPDSASAASAPSVAASPPLDPASAEEPFSLAHIREIVRRAHALQTRLAPVADPRQLEALAGQFHQIQDGLKTLEAATATSPGQRRALYLPARRLLRRLAFCNPLLQEIGQLLFIKRHDPGGLYHMVHQFYGFSAKPGGGLYVLSQPFGDHPAAVDLLAKATVQQGPLRGQRLLPGAFLSPEVSFDGGTILFAYTEAKAQGVEWSPRASYHLFRVRPDGSGLIQLTSGSWNDFDPCFLPSGRIAFISERRGGYLRCGGSSPPFHSPTYTLHSMAPDGSEIQCLSFHETQEWQPSVSADGLLVYTRWDYIDRDSNVAHHLWTCLPDGRNPRSFHGNYPRQRESRPWMEMDIRAIPGSHKFVATAAAHHGLAFGSLVLIDPRQEDDGAMAQLERITPEIPFPESETQLRPIRECMAFGSPWPLSEEDYLCVFDAGAKNRGIYWIDRHGNRELIYRDPEISCLSPMPLRPRPAPPSLPAGSAPANGVASPARATVAVVNVQESDLPWPGGSKPSALRIVQILPKTTPRANEPRIGVASQTNARAALGTVPLEPDGSAYFEAPAGKLLYFQVLDEDGMALQSMRSGTYLHPGEQLTCLGCHEGKHASPKQPASLPLALRREPSPIQPELEDAHPFSYPRLVQPVLDRHCVPCHAKKKALDLSGAAEGPHGWSRSYTHLASKFGFFFDSGKGSLHSPSHGGSRSIPGQFGARASRLLPYLDSRHHQVDLNREERRRLTLWLDLNSDFYGAYEDTEAQSRGEAVHPSLE